MCASSLGMVNTSIRLSLDYQMTFKKPLAGTVQQAPNSNLLTSMCLANGLCWLEGEACAYDTRPSCHSLNCQLPDLEGKQRLSSNSISSFDGSGHWDHAR